MKNRRLLLALTALLLACLFVLTACPKSPSPDQPDDPDEPEVLDEGAFFLNDPTAYTLITPDSASERTARAKAVELRKLLEELYGTLPAISDDWIESDESAESVAARREILVGHVDRPEVELAEAELGESGFVVRVIGNKLVLLGVTAEDTVSAIEYLMSYIRGTEENSPVLGLKEDFMFAHSYDPTLVETVYPQDDLVLAHIDVTQWPYLADATGKTDVTAILQQALDDLAGRGGGTVFLPAGQYLIKGTVNIPRGCLLKGDYQDPDVADPAYGTIILADPAPLDETYLADRTRSPLFNLTSACGVDGLTVYYPNQSIEAVVPYGYTIYAHLPACATIANITLLNSYRGIGINVHADGSHEMAQIGNIHITALEMGLEMYDSTDVGYTTRVRITPDYWANATLGFACSDQTRLENYCRANTIAMKFNGLDDTHLSDLYIAGARTAIYLPAGYTGHDFWGLIYDLTIERCDYGIVAESLNPYGGAAIAKASIGASKIAVFNSSSVGALKLSGVDFTDSDEVIAAGQGRIYLDDTTVLPDLSIREATYTQPVAKLYIAPVQSLSETKKDISALLQATLDEAGKTGGVVYLPAGIYSLYQPITVPAGVELRGSVPMFQCDSSWEAIQGTVLLTYVADTATITLKDNAGVNGLRLFSALTSPSEAVELLAAGAAVTQDQTGIRGEGSGVYAHNVVVTNLFNGIDFSGCDGHSVCQVFGSVWNDFIISGGRGGTVSRCLTNEHFSYRQQFMSGGYMNAQYYDGWTLDTAERAVLRDELRRVYGDAIRLVDAQEVCVSNVFAFAQAALVCAEDSQAILLNLSSDFHGMRAQLDVRGSSDLTALNLLRSANESILCEASASLKVYNRIAICRHGESDFDSAEGHLDEGRYQNIRQVTMLNDGSTAVTGTTVHRGDFTKTDGTSLYHAATDPSAGTTAQLFSQSFSGIRIDQYVTENGYLHLWVYVEDMSSSAWTGWVQLQTSGGTLRWSTIAYITHNGWNELWLPIKGGHGQAGGSLISLSVTDVRSAKLEHSDYYFDDIYLCLADTDQKVGLSNVTADTPAVAPDTSIPTLPYDPTVLISGDSLMGASASCGLVTTQGTFMEGSGAWQLDSGLNPIVRVSLSSRDLSAYMAEGKLHLWVYVEDASAITQGVLELTSSGTYDSQEISWWLNGRLQSGWNELELSLSSPDGSTDAGGAFQPGGCNYIRIFFYLSRPTTIRLDDVRVTLPEGATRPDAPDAQLPAEESFSFTVFGADEAAYLGGNAHVDSTCRFTDGSRELIYSYTIRDFSRLTSLIWSAPTSGQLKLEVSCDGNTWVQVYCYEGTADDRGLSRQTREYDLTDFVTEEGSRRGKVYVRITDAYPSSGYGGAVAASGETVLQVKYE